MVRSRHVCEPKAQSGGCGGGRARAPATGATSRAPRQTNFSRVAWQSGGGSTAGRLLRRAALIISDGEGVREMQSRRRFEIVGKSHDQNPLVEPLRSQGVSLTTNGAVRVSRGSGTPRIADIDLQSMDLDALRQLAERWLGEARLLQARQASDRLDEAACAELRARMADVSKVLSHLEHRLCEAPWADGALGAGPDR